MSQAYVFRNTTLIKEVHLIPPKELKMDNDMIWEVNKPLYGLPESGVRRFETHIAHHKTKLGMKSVEIDSCQLYRFDSYGKLKAIVCLQVDDTIASESE